MRTYTWRQRFLGWLLLPFVYFWRRLREELGAIFDSAVSVFLINDTGATERNLSTYITSIDGLPGARDGLDSTTLGATGHTYHPSLQNGRFTIELVWDDTATTGPDAVLGPLRTHTAAVTFKYGPKGSTGGFPRYTGSVLVTDYTITSRIGSLVLARAEFVVSGAVTRDTF